MTTLERTVVPRLSSTRLNKFITSGILRQLSRWDSNICVANPLYPPGAAVSSRRRDLSCFLITLMSTRSCFPPKTDQSSVQEEPNGARLGKCLCLWASPKQWDGYIQDELTDEDEVKHKYRHRKKRFPSIQHSRFWVKTRFPAEKLMCLQVILIKCWRTMELLQGAGVQEALKVSEADGDRIITYMGVINGETHNGGQK